MSEPDKALLRKAVARAVAGLTATGRLTIVEVAADGMTVFRIHRDDNGRPRCHYWSSSWEDLTSEQGWEHESSRQAVLRAADPLSADEVVLVCSFPEGAEANRALAWLSEARPAAVLPCDGPAVAVVEDVLASDPLSRSYDLVVLRADHASGRLRLGSKQLFPIGTLPGTRAEVTVRCEPGDEYGTAFAVVTWQGREPRLLSVHSARLTPGRYLLTAELVRPGKVRFTGVPELTRDPRGWNDLVAAAPSQLPPRAGPAHLICAVEVSGPDAKVEERLSRVRQMVSHLSAELADLLRVSLVAYGAHSYDDRAAREHPVEVAAWQVTPERALAALEWLEERGAITEGYPYYPHAAQVEDMLEAVARRLTTAEQVRTVLLTVGDRPPHPARTNRSLILPCPHPHDWRLLVGRVQSRPDTVLAAICDREDTFAHPAWRRLGANALAHLDALDIRGLAADLGLAAPAALPIPFPLLDETE
ncbi:hypothetical protein [Microbispora bryophytorum]|uniref:Uncharacterized protein n=1 Tax=Microbispora bryophytorum TaxID=1460882 RepID=A0A8H9GTP9_9ACTN|nr:hypothetical protein [Microbispora bryophytorum]MBD3135376.1 hypothetical protein [Microbispora bryophytorum]TQS09577.1 hypothetical protein FLX07_00370 [Microbispora bryophytorum]GGN97316.1 hypothetical protein GCM10011574_00760 [Microbispora bryophytorum]